MLLYDRQADARQVRDDVEILTTEEMAACDDTAKYSREIREPEVIDMLVEDVKPSIVSVDPV